LHPWGRPDTAGQGRRSAAGHVGVDYPRTASGGGVLPVPGQQIGELCARVTGRDTASNFTMTKQAKDVMYTDGLYYRSLGLESFLP
jgi:hypothetical protein